MGQSQPVKPKKILIAGGQCGPTMQMAAQKIEEACREKKIRIVITIQNLWESQFITETYDVIIELFTFFKNETCPVLDGKPFIIHRDEKELVKKIVDILNE